MKRALVIIAPVLASYVWALIVLGIEHLSNNDSIAFSAVFLIPLALGVVIYGLRSRALEGHVGTILAIALSGWSLTFLIMLSAQLDTPIFSRKSVTGSPQVLSMLVAGALPIATAIFAARFLPARSATWFGNIARRLGFIVLVLNTALFGMAIWRSIYHAESASYLPRLMIVGSAVPNHDIDIDGRTIHYEGSAADSNGRCSLKEGDLVLEDQAPCDGVDILYDSASDIHFVQFPRVGKPDFAIPHHGPARFSIAPRDVAKSLSPPTGWIHGAGSGVVLGLIAMLFARMYGKAARKLARTSTSSSTSTERALLEARAGSAATCAIVAMLLISSPLILAAAYGLVF